MKNYEGIASQVLDRLASQLPARYCYHNAEHTAYVIDKARLLAREEGLDKDRLGVLLLASAYHDIGFLKDHVDHENHSCDMAKADLEVLGFSPTEITEICEAIMATTIPQRPKNLEGKILADADLYHLGSINYDYFAKRLFDEMSALDPTFTRKRWLEVQIQFLKNHTYHTVYAKRELEPIKNQTLNRLMVCGPNDLNY